MAYFELAALPVHCSPDLYSLEAEELAFYFYILWDKSIVTTDSLKVPVKEWSVIFLYFLGAKVFGHMMIDSEFYKRLNWSISIDS